MNKLKTRRVKVIDESKEEGDPDREKWQDEYIVQETKVQKAASKVADDENGEAQAAEADGEDGASEYDYEKTKEEVTAQFRKELEEIRNETDSEECYDFDEEEIQQILEEVEKTVFEDDDAALKFFEQKYEEIMAVRLAGQKAG